jgi:hypothetical protein
MAAEPKIVGLEDGPFVDLVGLGIRFMIDGSASAARTESRLNET